MALSRRSGQLLSTAPASLWFEAKMSDLLIKGALIFKDEELELFSVLCWSLWVEMNGLLHNGGSHHRSGAGNSV